MRHWACETRWRGRLHAGQAREARMRLTPAPKSNAAYLAIDKALEDVKTKKAGNVPKHLRDASYPGAAKLDHGQGYKYAHDYPNHYVPQEYMPFQATYYEPTEMGYEKKIKERMESLRRNSLSKKK